MPQVYHRADETAASSANMSLTPPHPQLHRRRRRSSSSSSSSSLSSPAMSMTPRPTFTDADDSIVLSDLVRTGEASRLRRRGAMRLDRNVFHAPHSNPYVTHRPLAMDMDDSEAEDEPHTYAYASADGVSSFNRGTDRRHPHWTPNQHPYSRWSTQLNDEGESEGDYDITYTLVCGAEVDDLSCRYEADDYNLTPFKSSLLPIAPATTSHTPPLRKKFASNGCGTIVHLVSSASTCSTANTPVRTYVARSPATGAVVSLAPEYFQSSAGVKFESSPCGCIKEGIGCSVCGNPLGTRWKFCKMMAEGRRKPPIRGFERQPRPLRPEGPRYWHGTSLNSNSRSRSPIRTDFDLAGMGSVSPNTAPPCPSSSSGTLPASIPLSSPSNQTHTKPDSQPQIELYTFFANAVTAYRDSWSPSTKSTRRVSMPPTHPNSPLSSPRLATTPESQQTGLGWSSGVADLLEGLNSEDNEPGESALVMPPTEGQELEIGFGMDHFASFIETIPRQSRPTSLPSSFREATLTQSINQRSSTAMFTRHLTASPEPFQPSAHSSPELHRQRAPAFTFDTVRNTSDDSWTNTNQDGDRMISRLQSRVGGYPDDGDRTPTTRSVSERRSQLQTRTESLEQSLEEQRITHPQPRTLSFYQQQILGAWERERERDLQRDWVIDMRPARSRGRSPVGTDIGGWDLAPRRPVGNEVDGDDVFGQQPDELEGVIEEEDVTEANAFPPSTGRNRMFFDR